jgi:hypothetical protein
MFVVQAGDPDGTTRFGKGLMEELGREGSQGRQEKRDLLKTSKELSLVIRRDQRYQRHQKKKQIVQSRSSNRNRKHKTMEFPVLGGGRFH